MLLTPQQRLAAYIRDPSELHGGPQAVERLIDKYGLDDPVHLQYGRWLGGVLQGNLGWSQSASMPVSEALRRLLPATAEMALLAIVPIVFGGIVLGTLSATHQNRITDHALRLTSMFALALPAFVLGLIALMVLYGRFNWFPPGRLSQSALEIVNSSEFNRYTGMNILDAILNGQLNVAVDAGRHLFLPVLILAAQSWALMLRVMRSSMLETLRQDYITTARAKGLKENLVVNLHARRNALLPLVTLAGLYIAYLMGGVVIVESVFDYNGLGRFASKAAQQLDFSAVLGFTLFFAVILISVNLIVDLLYGFLDPRIRLD